MIGLKNRFGTANHKKVSFMSDLLETLRQEGVDPALLSAVEEYRTAHPLAEGLRPRIPASAFTYYGNEVWEQALAALAKICCWRAARPPARMCWLRTSPPPSAARRGISRSM